MKIPQNKKELVQLLVNRINKGVNFLDKELGKDIWRKRINLSELDLENSDMCICGQAFESTIKKLARKDGEEYADGYEYVTSKISEDKLGLMGFNLEIEITNDFPFAYDLLTSLWIAKLSKVSNTAICQ